MRSAKTSGGSGSPWVRGGNIRSANVFAAVAIRPPINPATSPFASDLSFVTAISVLVIASP